MRQARLQDRLRHDREVDERVYQALMTLQTVDSVPLKAIVAATHRSIAFVRRSIRRLIEANRVMVAGTSLTAAKLYAVTATADGGRPAPVYEPDEVSPDAPDAPPVVLTGSM